MQALIASLGMTGELVLVYQGKDGKGSIYISNFISASQENLLQQNNIGSILTVAKGFRLKHRQEVVPLYCYINAEDKKAYDIRKHFEKCFQFINQSRQQTNILVHCKAGVSRSATVIIAYLMQQCKIGLIEAYDIVKQAHPKIKPNLGFIAQLIDFNRQLGYQQASYDVKTNSFTKAETNNNNKQHKFSDMATHAETTQQKHKKSDIIAMLRKDQHKIDIKIQQIKSMIEHNSARNRTMSEYLKAKLVQFRKETTECRA